MKLFLALALLSLTGSLLAETGNCVINRKHRGTGTFTERPSVDGNGVVILLEIDLKYDRWRGSIARKTDSGNFENMNVRPAHRYAKSIYQKVRGKKISYDYLNPGYKGMKSELKINEAQEIVSVKGNETIYNDFGGVEGRNSFSCEF